MDDGKCFGWRFFDREEIEKGSEVLLGKRKNFSGMYLVGRLLTADDVRREVKDSRILLSNMEANGWPDVVQTRCGNFQPVEDDTTVIPE